MKREYLENDLDNPKYLFSGSPILLEYLEPRKARDDNHNPLNEDTAVYLTSSLVIASAYSFGRNEKYKGMFATDRIDGMPYVCFENDLLDGNTTGYIYVFENDKEKFIHNGGESLQYRSHEKIKPIDTICIEYKDFKGFYEIKNKQMSI